MRFHVLAVPHTITNKDFVACAFTQKVLKFCDMMTRRGHTVIHYGHEDSDVFCTEHVTVIDRETYTRIYGNYDWKTQNFKFDLLDEAYQTYNANAVREIRARQQHGDFVLAFWGQGNKHICDQLGDMKIVEPGIGYSQAFAPYRIYESYALMHANLGLDLVQHSCNMPWYHVVIPNYFDPKDFEFSSVKQDYFLYLGRITRAKGVDLAINVTAHIGAKLIIAGQGGPNDLGLDAWPSHVEYVGYAFADKRRELMKNAKGVFIFSTYVEPFAGVMIESFLSGTPVISTDWGTFAENNLHGLTGYRCRTFEHMVWAAKNIHQIDSQACRTWGENFTLDKVAPMYEEYFKAASRSWYDMNELRPPLEWFSRTYPVPPQRKTIDAFFQCYNQVPAADRAFASYRSCYPDGKVIMINDGGDEQMKDIAAKHGAEYMYMSNIGICHWKNPTEWLERFFEAVQKFENEYFVMQEEDVWHVRPIDHSKLVFDICGTNPDAKFPNELVEYIRKETGRECTHYSGSGGCFFKTKFFKELAKTDWRTHVRKFPAQWLHADIVISALTYLNHGTIGYCTECVEIGRPEYETQKNPVVIHQYKAHYETPLCRLARKYGSDKCPWISHTYTPEYHRLLNGLNVKNMLEIGIGNVPLMMPIVGEKYQPGASLRMWRDYFPEANVYGCDIVSSVLFEEDRIKTFWVDQSSEEILQKQVPDLQYELILDDGSHNPDHMETSFKALWPRVSPNGLYIIEDIHVSYIDRIKKLGPIEYIHPGKKSSDIFVVFRKPEDNTWGSFTVEKRNGKLIYKSYGCDGQRNDSLFWCIQRADEVYNWNDFAEYRFYTNDYETVSNSWAITSASKCFNRTVPDFTFHNWSGTLNRDYDEVIQAVSNAGLEPFTVNKVVWVGKYSNNARLTLMEIANQNPDMFDCTFMDWGQDCMTPSKFIPMEDQVRTHSIVIDVEGYGYSARVKYLLWSRRPLLLVDREHKEFYYKWLVPWEHYIPVKHDMSDLVEKTRWCLDNYDQAKQIAENAYKFSTKYLTRAACYRRWNEIFQPQRILWLTAFRDIKRGTWPMETRTTDEYFTYFDHLVRGMKGRDFICFIDEPDAERVRKLGVRTLPYDIDDTYIPKYYARHKELIETKAFHHLLPEHLRNQPEYTIPDYALTLYSKQCFVRRASDLFPGYTHYAWVDFGYARVPEDAHFPAICTQVPTDQVYISSFRSLEFNENKEPILGNWDSEGFVPYDWNNWRLWMSAPLYMIQGNLWFVPKKFTHWLEKEMERSIERQYAAGFILSHEEPLWLPIIHDFRSRFKIHTKTDWRRVDWL